MWRTTHMWFEGNERLKKNGDDEDDDDDKEDTKKKKASSAADFQSLVHLKSLFGNRFSVAQCPRGSTRDKMLNTAVLSMPLRNRESRTTLFEDLNCMHGNDDNMIRFDGKSEDSNRVCCDIYFCGNVSTMSKPYVVSILLCHHEDISQITHYKKIIRTPTLEHQTGTVRWYGSIRTSRMMRRRA